MEKKDEMKKTPQRVLDKRRDWAKGDAERDSVITKAQGVKEYKDISYGPYGIENLLDVYVSECQTKRHSQKELVTVKSSEDQVLPVIVSIHGGGYFYGDKELYSLYCLDLAARGFVVVNFNYRLAPENHFPAPIEDIHQVMNWVADHISEYKGDAKRLFMVGDSAGAQLVSHYATIWSNPEFAALYKMAKANIEIKGVGLACGVYDIIKRAQNKIDQETMEDYLGTDIDLKNPIYNVPAAITKDFPPAYLFTAANDFLKSECEPMAKLLSDRGVYNEWKCYGTEEQKEVSHVFHINLELPEAEEANNAQIDFFRKQLL